jgi:hypothetical protein
MTYEARVICLVALVAMSLLAIIRSGDPDAK